jgi:ketosteroid isomerase-like protein
MQKDRPMTRTLLAAALLALLVTSTGGANDADAEKRVAMLSKQHREAVVKGDTKALDAILADDWVEVGPTGDVETRDQQAKDMKDGKVDYDAIDPREVKVRVYGDAAVVMGCYHIKARHNGQRHSDLFRVTEVYARQGGEWRCVFTQVTRVVGEPGEER